MRSILVPLDGSALAERALGPAIDIAERAGATLHLVRVHQGLPSLVGARALVNWSSVDEDIRRSETEYLAEVADRARADSAVLVDLALTAGVSVDEICGYARDVGAELVVMTTHARTGLSRAVLGSVGDVVTRGTGVPVLLVRADAHPGAMPAEARFRRIFVPLDGSPSAEAVLPMAASLGALLGATLVLARHVARVAPERYVGMRVMLAECARETFTRQLEHAERYLAGVAASLREARDGLRVTTEVLRDGQVPDAIVRAARASGAGLVALTTRAHGAGRLFAGCVADAVLRDTRGDVLLLRATPVRAMER